MSTIEVKVPDIGDFKDVEVIEVLVRPGDRISVEQSLLTVESDKASMEIPSSVAGVLKELKVSLGDHVSEGTLIAILEDEGGGAAAAPAAPQADVPKASGPAPAPTPAPGAAPAPAPAAPAPAPAAEGGPAAGGKAPAGAAQTVREEVPPAPSRVSPTAELAPAPAGQPKPHASPSVRKFARELGVDLTRITGSGEKQRITHDDVRAWVKAAVARPDDGGRSAAPADAGAPLGLIPWPKVDFEKFGPVQRERLSRIRKISAANLHRNWVMIPHVTNHEEADVTELEAFRVRLNEEQGKAGVKVTMLAFLVKACVAALERFPEFNASLDGDELVLRRYWNIGFAADTPNGLVVPVIRDADAKGVLQIAAETAELAARAREGKLSPADMQGGTFSISSLGGIGGTTFTPIINAPEVAILGVCRAATKPAWDGAQFVPRLMLPLSLSYDHRVIDGAAAARFNAYLAALLADFRRAML